MPDYPLVITNEAELDISEGRRWYQEHALLDGAFVAQLDHQFESIERQPFARPVVAYGIWRLVVRRFPYNIYYAVNGEIINILAVLHGCRDQSQLLGALQGHGGD